MEKENVFCCLAQPVHSELKQNAPNVKNAKKNAKPVKDLLTIATLAKKACANGPKPVLTPKKTINYPAQKENSLNKEKMNVQNVSKNVKMVHMEMKKRENVYLAKKNAKLVQTKINVSFVLMDYA